MHRPEAALVGGAVGDMCGKQRARMDIDQREIAVDKIDFAGVDILRFELGLRLTDEGVAERSLVIAVLDHGDWRIWVAKRALLGLCFGIQRWRGGEGWLVLRRDRGGGRGDARRSLATTCRHDQRQQHNRQWTQERTKANMRWFQLAFLLVIEGVNPRSFSYAQWAPGYTPFLLL